MEAQGGLDSATWVDGLPVVCMIAGSHELWIYLRALKQRFVAVCVFKLSCNWSNFHCLFPTYSIAGEGKKSIDEERRSSIPEARI